VGTEIIVGINCATMGTEIILGTHYLTRMETEIIVGINCRATVGRDHSWNILSHNNGSRGVVGSHCFTIASDLSATMT
jgi:hypothetical protein